MGLSRSFARPMAWGMTDALADAGASAPANTALPEVTGTAEIGETLSASDGTWTGSPAPTFAYQWFRADPTYASEALVTSGGDIVYTNAADITGETGATYTLAAADANKVVGCRVTATNSAGSDSADSFVTQPVMDPDAAVYLARHSSTTDEDRTHYNTFVLALKTAGIFAGHDGIYWLATDASADALDNMREDAFNLTIGGTPTFAAKQGFTGNGSDAELTTGYNPASSGGSFAQDDSCMWAWVRTAVDDFQPIMGTLEVGEIAALIPNFGGDFLARINAGSYSTFSTEAGTGFFMVNRLAAGTQTLRHDADAQDFSVASISVANAQIAALRGQFGFSSSQLLAFGFGSGLTPTEAGNLRSALSTLKTALGA